jgi:hypothetical protein
MTELYSEVHLIEALYQYNKAIGLKAGFGSQALHKRRYTPERYALLPVTVETAPVPVQIVSTSCTDLNFCY